MSILAETYIEERFTTSGKQYKAQWAKRFEDGTEWAYSDLGGRIIPQRLCPDIYPKSIYESM